jgi:hypothetical protein
MLDERHAAVLEALLDERLEGLPLPAEVVRELEEVGLDGPGGAAALEAFVTARPIEWATRTTTQGQILAAFTVHCLDDLEEVEVVEATPARIVVRWRKEVSRLELRAGFLGLERLASETPTMLLGDLEPVLDELVPRFVADSELRSRLAVYDLARLEKVGAVRSSAFVYFEWFLRDEYGVKLLPAAAFTQGLIDRGIISLGMG